MQKNNIEIAREICMTEHEVLTRVNKVFEESFEIESDKLLPGANIFENLGLDSLDIVDLVVALQQEFGVKIRDDKRVMDIRTLEDIYKFILALQQGMQI